jgi:glutamate 5-kinase
MSTESSLQELLIVKIGTDTITRDGRLDQRMLANVTEEIAELTREGIRVVLVASGAVGAGIPAHATAEQRELLRTIRPTVSTVGQIKLMNALSYHLDHHDIEVAQWLTEPHDFDSEEGRASMLQNFDNLPIVEGVYGKPIIPILNTNDFVTPEGFETDNDRLAGFATSIFPAIRKRLVLLTNKPGLMTDLHDDSSVIREIRVGEEDCRQYICSETSENGSGDMHSKYDVAEAAALEGHCSFIGDGKVQGAIRRLLDRIDGTIFLPPGYTDDS